MYPATLNSTSTWSCSLARASTWSFLVTSTTLVLMPDHIYKKRSLYIVLFSLLNHIAFYLIKDDALWGVTNIWTTMVSLITHPHNFLTWQVLGFTLAATMYKLHFTTGHTVALKKGTESSFIQAYVVQSLNQQ